MVDDRRRREGGRRAANGRLCGEDPGGDAERRARAGYWMGGVDRRTLRLATLDGQDRFHRRVRRRGPADLCPVLQFQPGTSASQPGRTGSDRGALPALQPAARRADRPFFAPKALARRPGFLVSSGYDCEFNEELLASSTKLTMGASLSSSTGPPGAPVPSRRTYPTARSHTNVILEVSDAHPHDGPRCQRRLRRGRKGFRRPQLLRILRQGDQ